MKIIKKTTEVLYSGRGYTQAMGVEVSQDVVTLFGRWRFITSIHFLPEREWIRQVKRRIAEDDVQQAREKKP